MPDSSLLASLNASPAPASQSLPREPGVSVADFIHQKIDGPGGQVEAMAKALRQLDSNADGIINRADDPHGVAKLAELDIDRFLAGFGQVLRHYVRQFDVNFNDELDRRELEWYSAGVAQLSARPAMRTIQDFLLQGRQNPAATGQENSPPITAESLLGATRALIDRHGYPSVSIKKPGNGRE